MPEVENGMCSEIEKIPWNTNTHARKNHIG